MATGPTYSNLFFSFVVCTVNGIEDLQWVSHTGRRLPFISGEAPRLRTLRPLKPRTLVIVERTAAGYCESDYTEEGELLNIPAEKLAL